MMKSTLLLKKHGRRVWPILAILVSLGACKKLDDTYRDYIKDGEIIYVSKADSLRAFPGIHRAQLTWLATTDPKVTKAIISWNGGESTHEHLTTRIPGKVWEKVTLENLAEGSYTFEVVTYDERGNKSIKTSVQGHVFGEDYIASVQNRNIKKASIFTTDEEVLIEWSRAPEGVIGTEVEYTDTHGIVRTITVSANKNSTAILDYELETAMRHRSLVTPDTLSIDTLYTDFKEFVPEVSYLKNTGSPTGFTRNPIWDGSRYGTLADWIVNAAARNASGGLYGDYELEGGIGRLSLQGGIAARPVITNGKIYQTTTLPAGRYSFTVGGISISNNSINTRHQVVAIGEELPNRENLATEALAYNSIANPQDFGLEFTLATKTRVSIGFVVSFSGGHWLKVNQVNLIKIE